MEHLNEFEIINVCDDKDELDFIKLILAKSPVLKKVNILIWKGVHKKDEKLCISRTLLASPRASPAVRIMIEHGV